MWKMMKEVVVQDLKEPMNLVHSERCLSINQAYYKEILKWLCEGVCR
jgi:hypothetical protein